MTPENISQNGEFINTSKVSKESDTTQQNRQSLMINDGYNDYIECEERNTSVES
jgi:hypothetical protein